ncbi:MAG TPA: hypothetical protein PK011_06965 [Marinagarivorans sp.]|nr:hypothetical protein [Marinagarivorans sp.]
MFRVEGAIGLRGNTPGANGLVDGGIADASVAGIGPDGDADSGGLLN